jgi:glycosyltransferase involved in cell wall biosynthesis
MIFNVSSTDKFGEKYQQYQRQIIELGLQDVFLLCNVQMSFVRLIEMADMVVRPTNTDGDALTIKEALYLGKPVLASDVVKRPDGTNLFKNRDVADMADKMAVMLERNKNNFHDSGDDSKIRYYDLYRNLVNSVLSGK